MASEREDTSRDPTLPQWRNPAVLARGLHAVAIAVAGALVSLAIGARGSADAYGTAVLLGLLLVLVVLASWLGRLPRTAPLLRWAAGAGLAFLVLLCIITTEGPPAWREDALIAGMLTTLAVAVFLLGRS
jgi:hypothetical protein